MSGADTPRTPPRPLDPDLWRELYVAHGKIVEAFVDGMVLLLLAERGRLDARQDAEDLLRTLKASAEALRRCVP